jgi:hypothetical protein
VNKPHKHAEIIKKWVDGHHIQGQSPSTDKWIDVPDVNNLAHKNNWEDNYLSVSPIHPEYDWWPNWRLKP